MRPEYHILSGLIIGAFLFYTFPQIGVLGFSLIFLSSFLIDIDHYIYYGIYKKDWNIINSIKWYITIRRKTKSMPRKQRNNYFNGFCLLHGFEILLLLIISSFLFIRLFSGIPVSPLNLL